jgi:hypothetical protein
MHDLLDKAFIFIDEYLCIYGHVNLLDVKEIIELTEYVLQFEFRAFGVELIDHHIAEEIEVL